MTKHNNPDVDEEELEDFAADEDGADDGGADDGGAELPADLLERAEMLGWDRQQVSARFKDPQALQSSLDFFVDSFLQDDAGQGQQQQQTQDPPADEPLFKPEELEEMGPELKTIVERVTGKLGGEVKRLRDELTAERTAQAQRAHETFASNFDKAVNELGEDLQPLFGTGSIHQLQGTLEEQNRIRVFRTAVQLKRGIEARGMAAPSEAALLREAVRRVFPKQAAVALARGTDQQAQKLRDSQGRFSATAPSGGVRKSKPGKATTKERFERGSAVVGDWAAKHGLHLAD